MNFAQLGINRIEEFIRRYQYIKEDAFDELYPVPNRVNIYREYYIKWIGGRGTRYFYLFMLTKVQPFWQDYISSTLKFYPSAWLDNFKREYLDAHPKTAGWRLVRNYLLIVLVLTLLALGVSIFLFVILPLRLLRWCFGKDPPENEADSQEAKHKQF
jgi:hypothetical protein